jgi:hypothetical protein
MAELISALQFSGPMQKVLETPNGYVMNGVYHDKTTMAPRPFDFYPAFGDTLALTMNQSFLNRHAYDSFWGKTHGDLIVRDNYNPEIFYSWVIGSRLNYNFFHKYRETTSKVELISHTYYSGWPTSYPMVQQYCGQNKEYLYYIMATGNAGNTYFVRINKTTLANETIDSFATYSVGTAFRETDGFVYYGYQEKYGNTYMKRYNKTTNISEIIKCNVLNSSRYFTTRICDPIQLSDTSDYTFALHHDPTANKHYITKYLLDYSKTDLLLINTETTASIDWGSLGYTEIKPLPSATYFQYELFTIKASNGKMYLGVEVSALSGQSPTANINDLGIYVFLIDPTTRNLTFKGFTQPSSSLYRGFLGINNNLFLIATTDISMIFLRFDETAEKFVVQETINNQPYFIGADQAENIWIINGSQEVEMISPLVPKDTVINYEFNSYKYLGSDINTYITIESKNYNNANVVANIDLTISGNAVFTSNGIKTIQESTIATGPKMIPVTIKGPGSVTVYPKLVL